MNFLDIAKTRYSVRSYKDKRVEKEKLEQMMINTGMLTKDLGTILVGKEAVRQGLIDEVGGISAALEKLRSLMAD